MLPVLVGLDALVVVLAPCDGLVNHLLDAKPLHLIFIFQDVVEDRLAHAVKVVLVDLVQHRVDQVLDSLFLNGMQVPRNEFYDVSEPVLTDRSNDVDLDLVLNILSVSPVGDLTGTHVRITKCRLSHDSLILLGLVGRLNVLFAYDVQLGSCIVDVLESNRAGIHINVEALSARGEVRSNTVTHGKIVPLRGDWGRKGPAKGVNHGWEATVRL